VALVRKAESHRVDYGHTSSHRERPIKQGPIQHKSIGKRRRW
jgi:hypothetical protein